MVFMKRKTARDGTEISKRNPEEWTNPKPINDWICDLQQNRQPRYE